MVHRMICYWIAWSSQCQVLCLKLGLWYTSLTRTSGDCRWVDYSIARDPRWLYVSIKRWSFSAWLRVFLQTLVLIHFRNDVCRHWISACDFFDWFSYEIDGLICFCFWYWIFCNHWEEFVFVSLLDIDIAASLMGVRFHWWSFLAGLIWTSDCNFATRIEHVQRPCLFRTPHWHRQIALHALRADQVRLPCKWASWLSRNLYCARYFLLIVLACLNDVSDR